MVDHRAQLLQRCSVQHLAAERGQQALQVLQRVVAETQLVEALVEGGQVVAVHVPVGQPAIERVGRLNLIAADAQVDAQFTGNAGQEITAAHVREIADAHFGHAQPAALGDDT
ncbi:hypothetical protein D3C80_1924120 [compost metagenome]